MFERLVFHDSFVLFQMFGRFKEAVFGGTVQEVWTTISQSDGSNVIVLYIDSKYLGFINFTIFFTMYVFCYQRYQRVRKRLSISFYSFHNEIVYYFTLGQLLYEIYFFSISCTFLVIGSKE